MGYNRARLPATTVPALPVRPAALAVRRPEEMETVAATRYADYRRAVQATLETYRRRSFAGREALFERTASGQRLFRSEVGHLNFFDPALYHALTRRPRAFRRLADPQVLAISLLGTLARREGLGLLARVLDDDGQPIVAEAAAEGLVLDLQPAVHHAAGRRAVVDLWLRWEGEATEERGPLAVQGRLLERGLGPLAATVRAVQAAAGTGYVLLVYDARNPAYLRGRQTDREFQALRAGLPPSLALRRTTWQALAAAMAAAEWYSDLLAYLRDKYGLLG